MLEVPEDVLELVDVVDDACVLPLPTVEEEVVVWGGGKTRGADIEETVPEPKFATKTDCSIPSYMTEIGSCPTLTVEITALLDCCMTETVSDP